MATKPRNMDIQSKDHETLLNLIDNLRSLGTSTCIDLPQIVVVGDQSSGKSSVLEALSGLAFPTKDALCTRFATELILRRSSEASQTVSIVADANCSDDEKQQLHDGFAIGDLDVDVYEDLGAFFEAAGVAMGLDSTKRFSNHTLRIELKDSGKMFEN
ncbi:hypothetical protein LTR64_000135 [Lithohypha guttulata]|uniref:uncharacterized protein n=1 Tax=Lithohypha guttulata TaxID=1690604 RepID=UPI002DDF5E67|nr:hypothetical protein LTR51_007497 [Lithohypha guttulata]